jgi:hypothetical protein
VKDCPLNLLRAIPIPVKHLFKTERLFEFRITRQLARNHQNERPLGYISVRVVDNLYSYEITDDGRAALKRSDGG